MNRLAGETSPYLRQHADNPVDWYPWGDEAFAAALQRDVPVLLSVGYSSCHWCHVMAHESFEDPATAEVMNQLFVNVKVDREERPDVDAVYMEAVQALTGQGGWPMTVFLTPEAKPFFAGTYFPRTGRGNMPSFTRVLTAVAEAWSERRPELLEQADELARSVGARTGLPPVEDGRRPTSLASALSGADDPAAGRILDAAYRSLRQLHDDQWGGFGRAPKFPQTSMIELVLRAYSHNRSPDTLKVVTDTLDAMASGGIYDHLGGGFSRYSVDERWLVPHFEKMLYDQAGLARAYLHGWLCTGHDRWLQVLDETVAYVLRDLRSPEGGLYSAEDADSEGEEGRFYVWHLDEVRRLLGPDLAPAAIEWYGMTEAGNFEGANILYRPSRGDLIRPAEIEKARTMLFEARSQRVRPGLDDKVITEWNAMFCASMAEAGAGAARSDWLEAAEQTAEFLLAELRRPDGRWLRSWQGGRSRHLAYASDYAWLMEAFLRLYQALGRRRWLDEAVAVADDTLRLFWDDASAGLFTTGADAERLIVRTKDLFDGATPSANSVAAAAFLRLEALTGRADYGERARQMLDAVLDTAASHPSAFTHWLASLDTLAGGITEVVVPGRGRLDLVGVVQRRYLPDVVLAWGEAGTGPLWEGRQEGLAYLCQGYVCQAPAADAATLEAQISTR
ncbi:MAG TPA: thioredoxin domain-containing protein [Acidimicrobiales bacterium]|nr:thioredoxin domain-containing protein [Acidimicrobiales bacterium]